MKAKDVPPILYEVFRYGVEYLYMDDYYALPDSDVDVCVPRRGIYVLKVMARYARIQRSWVAQVFDDTRYEGVYGDDWDSILATIAGTEAGLMSFV